MDIIEKVFDSIAGITTEAFLLKAGKDLFIKSPVRVLTDAVRISEELTIASMEKAIKQLENNPDMDIEGFSDKMAKRMVESVNKAADEYVLLLKAEAKTPAEVQMNQNAYLVSQRVKLTLVDFWKQAEHRFLCEYPDTDDRNIIEAGLNYWRSRRTCSHKDDNP